MEFNEDCGKTIIEKFGLSPTTLKVWKTRNRIPDKYARDEYVKVNFITDKADKILWSRVANILHMEEINSKTLIKLANADLTRVYSAYAGKSNVTKAELLNLIKEIKRLRLDIIKKLENYNEKEFLELISDARLKVYKIVEGGQFGKRLIHGRSGNVILSKSDFLEAKDYYFKLTVQLNIN